MEVGRPWPGASDPSNAGSLDSSSTAPEAGSRPTHYSLLAVFDGHNGNMAAQLAGQKTLGLLEDRLPWSAPPAEEDESEPAVAWRGAVQRALVETLVELNWLFAGHGMTAGCTATLVVQVGWLLTVANVGDSRALLDWGADVLLLTEDHRVASHKGERRRLEAVNARIAPIHVSGQGPAASADDGIGPLRVWPGGLCLSRAIGDFDVGKSILPFPHVKQVRAPREGARLILASDGLWDAFEADRRVATLARGWSPETAPTKLINTVISVHDRLRDDTTVVVVDLLPPGTASFQEVCAPHSMMAAVRRGGARVVQADAVGCFGCFGAKPKPRASPDPSARPDPSQRRRPKPVCRVLADADTAAVVGLMTPGWDGPGVGATWYDREIGEELRRVTEAAWVEWRRAAACRYKGLYIPEPEESSRWRRGERLLDKADEGSEQAAEEAVASPMQRSVSTFFRQSVATDQSDYAMRFGHYKTAARPRPIAAAAAAPRGEGSGSGTSTRVRTSYLEDAVADEGSARAGVRVRYAPSPERSAASSARGSDPSVRVRGFGAAAKELAGEGDAEVADEAALEGVLQRVASDNPRVHMGREDSLREVAPVTSALRAPGNGHAPGTVRFADRSEEILQPVRVVRRGSGLATPQPAPAALADPGSGSVASLSPAWDNPAGGVSPEILSTPDLDMDGRASKHRQQEVESA